MHQLETPKTPRVDARLTFMIRDGKDMDLVARCSQPLHAIKTITVNHTRATDDSEHDSSEADGLFKIASPMRNQAYLVIVNHQPRVSAQVLIHQVKNLSERADVPAMVITPYISDGVAEQLRKENIAYLDAAGNAWLNDPAMHLWFRGFRPKAPTSRPTRLFSPAGLQLIATLLASVDSINWPYRTLADAAGISLSTTSDLLKEFHATPYVRRVGPTRKVVVQRRELFQQWEMMYHTRLRSKLSPQSYRSVLSGDMESLLKALPKDLTPMVLVGGEFAAAAMTNYLRPEGLTLHCLKPEVASAVRMAFRLVPDPMGSIILMNHFSGHEMWRWKYESDFPLIHPMLVHAELLGADADSRLRETATKLFDETLKPLLNDEE